MDALCFANVLPHLVNVACKKHLACLRLAHLSTIGTTTCTLLAWCSHAVLVQGKRPCVLMADQLVAVLLYWDLLLSSLLLRTGARVGYAVNGELKNKRRNKCFFLCVSVEHQTKESKLNPTW